jgi:hypothetical protein
LNFRSFQREGSTCKAGSLGMETPVFLMKKIRIYKKYWLA